MPRIRGGELRPLGVGEILDVAINLYFRNIARLLGIAAAVIVPLVLIVFALDLIGLSKTDVFNPDAALYKVGDTVRVLDHSRYVLVSIVEAVIGVIGYLLVIGAVFRAVSEAYLGHPLNLRESLNAAARRIGSLFWLSLLLVLGLGLGLICLILPGIYLLVAWAVAVPVLMVEGLRGAKAIGRSYDLVRHNWWRTFGVLIVGLIFIGLFNFLLDLVAKGADGLASDSVYLWAFVYDALNGLSTIITAPLQAAIIVVIYYDLRVRKEGFDVALLTAGLDQNVPAAAAPPADAPIPGSISGGPAPESQPPPATGA